MKDLLNWVEQKRRSAESAKESWEKKGNEKLAAMEWGKESAYAATKEKLKKFISVNNSVSGNEANPKNLQSGEVAVCECNIGRTFTRRGGINYCDICSGTITNKQTDR